MSTKTMDAIAYKNGQKNQWRRHAWNLIEDMTNDHSNAIVLYLPGSTDLDRAEALRRGYRPANMIAVERDENVAAALRQQGVTTICGGLTDVLLNWPAAHPIGVIIADLQCGLTADALTLGHVYATHPALNGTVLLVNLQRGRDAETNDIRAMRSHDPVGREYDHAALHRISKVAGDTQKHRGVVFAQCLKVYFDRWVHLLVDLLDIEAESLMDLGRLAEKYAATASPQTLDRWVGRKDASIARIAALKDWLKVVPLPSYRSAERSPLFDGVVLKAWTDPCARAPFLEGDRRLKGKIAAALAIRTRRLRGELRSA